LGACCRCGLITGSPLCMCAVVALLLPEWPGPSHDASLHRLKEGVIRLLLQLSSKRQDSCLACRDASVRNADKRRQKGRGWSGGQAGVKRVSPRGRLWSGIDSHMQPEQGRCRILGGRETGPTPFASK